jgi:hypothetical protein
LALAIAALAQVPLPSPFAGGSGASSGSSNLLLVSTGAITGASTPPSMGTAPQTTDTLLYTSAAVPVLAVGGSSGSCYKFELYLLFATNAGGNNPTIWFGPTIASAGQVYMYASTSLNFRARGVICNIISSQSSQNVLWDAIAGSSSPTGFTGIGTMAIDTTVKTNKFFVTNATNNGSGVTSSGTFVVQFSVWQQ